MSYNRDMSNNTDKQSKQGFLVSPHEFFAEAVENGLARRNVKAPPGTQTYLVGLLEHYLDSKNFVEQPSTLAEMFFQAANTPAPGKLELLKRLGDRSLYISGFFGDSLSRKAVDVDYYADMGGAAYASLATFIREDMTAQMYRTFSNRFIDFVDVLTEISQQSMVQSDEGLLRLYDRYVKTGSELAREKLIEMGVLTLTPDQVKLTKQD
jgi:hypothetical protein